MRGLELCRAYFERFGRPMLEEQFAEVLPQLAVGLIGAGSECFGFDDAVSRDHDFEPGFCIFLPGEDVVDRRTAFLPTVSKNLLIDRPYPATPIHTGVTAAARGMPIRPPSRGP